MRTADSRLPGLEQKTRFLLAPEVYPDATTSVRLVETHMARVFLTDHFVYKMKKPVRFDYLDFSSLDKRYGVCSEELRLNRRLTDGVYLEVVALRLGADGKLTLEQGGTPVEWLVKMRRLRQEDCLRQQLEYVSGDALAPLLQRLQDFYRMAVPVPLSAHQYLGKLRQRIEAVRCGLRTPELALDRTEIENLAARLNEITHVSRELIGGRATSGHIVEGHGDLRPEHCFLSEPPQIIDCLEFNRDLRSVDPLDELCYLALECKLLGRPDLCTQIVGSYSEDGAPDPVLVAFYQGYRGFLRAQLAAAHLLDDVVTTPEKWQKQTRSYLDIARSALCI